jgi:uncharacterized protein (TIGR03663 family)
MSSSPSLGDVPGLGRLDTAARRVVALVVLGAVARLAFLGGRVAHYDEGRVAWWSQYFLETGQFEYRYIIHGPLVQHVNRVVFELLGPTDFAMRLVVAVVGILLPLSAFLFREHLSGNEMVGMAFFLALNPLLLYYSRFFRSTLPAAAFAFVAFGLLVRASDERDLRYIHGAVVFVALAFTAKENAAVYLIVWVGATALLTDHVLFRTGGDESGVDWLRARYAAHRDRLGHYRASVLRYIGHLLLAVGLFFVVTLYFYAPREPNSADVGFWKAVFDPTRFPALVSQTLDDVVEGYGYWFGGSTEAGCRKDNIIDAYLCFLGNELQALGGYALPMTAMAVVGFLADRYGRSRSRFLVLFAAYWGFVSIIGYPLGTDIANAWIAVNALVPLSIPAGVGVALLFNRARAAVDDPVRFGVVVFVLLLIPGQMAVAMAGGVYANGTAEENHLVQYAQPADDFRPAMSVLEDRTADDGLDVLFVGDTYVRDNLRSGGIEPYCTSISDVLPLQWYVSSHGATGGCAPTAEDATERLSTGDIDPEVVIAPAGLEGDLAPALAGYESEVYGLRTYGSEAVFFTENATAN